MNRYVVGFLFDTKKTVVLLVEKKRPEWQKGLLNGVGGSIEEGETPEQTMHREAREEVGLTPGWIQKGVMKGINNDGSEFECYLFYAYDDMIFSCTQGEDEVPDVYLIESLDGYKTIENLKYLIPYGICSDGESFITIDYKSHSLK